MGIDASVSEALVKMSMILVKASIDGEDEGERRSWTVLRMHRRGRMLEESDKNQRNLYTYARCNKLRMRFSRISPTNCSSWNRLGEELDKDKDLIVMAV